MTGILMWEKHTNTHTPKTFNKNCSENGSGKAVILAMVPEVKAGPASGA